MHRRWWEYEPEEERNEWKKNNLYDKITYNVEACSHTQTTFWRLISLVFVSTRTYTLARTRIRTLHPYSLFTNLSWLLLVAVSCLFTASAAVAVYSVEIYSHRVHAIRCILCEPNSVVYDVVYALRAPNSIGGKTLKKICVWKCMCERRAHTNRNIYTHGPLIGIWKICFHVSFIPFVAYSECVNFIIETCAHSTSERKKEHTQSYFHKHRYVIGFWKTASTNKIV